MPVLARVTGLSLSKAALESDDLRPVYVYTYSIPGANVHQTIYYPDLDLGIYRASLSGDQLIIESIEPELPGFEFSVVCQSFGIPNKCYAGNTAKPFKELGKFASIPDVVRKSFMLEASTKLNIWSLGRYACWRPSVLLDDVYLDVLKIRAMIGQHNYNVRLNTL
jgi:hypothetical protein